MRTAKEIKEEEEINYCRTDQTYEINNCNIINKCFAENLENTLKSKVDQPDR